MTIAHDGSGDVTVIAARQGLVIILTNWLIQPTAADATIQWKSSGSSVGPEIVVPQGTVAGQGYSPNGYFRSLPGEGLVLASDAALTGSFDVRYEVAPAS